MAQKLETYRDFWNSYVDKFPTVAHSSPDLVWPGDEWGTPESWRRLFDLLFVTHVTEKPCSAIEIGGGSGKYTQLFLDEYAESKVLSLDVSNQFIEILRKRLHSYIESKRLSTGLLAPVPSSVEMLAEQNNMAAGSVDVFFSIDSMVHVDLQYLVAYWLSAYRLLRSGGKLIMTLADATTEGGYDKLIKDIDTHFSGQGRQTGKFEWLCPQLIRYILSRIGFEVIDVPVGRMQRDFLLVARKIG